MQKPWRALTPEEAYVIEEKGTERPFSGKYDDFFENGIFTCRRCHHNLYPSKHKFHSHCGWPSFDDEIPAAIKRLPDRDGKRTEILCANCDAHLGHVFTGEFLTSKNIRHCVNSLSISFLPFETVLDMALANDETCGIVFFAAGCFWGVEKKMSEAPGVLITAVGYMGGKTDHPSYETVCKKNTGHAETVAVIFNKHQTDMRRLLDVFFEIHDPTQLNRQGPDHGSQYRSAIFPVNNKQQKVAEEKIMSLKQKGIPVVTTVEPKQAFWMAEKYHQQYFKKK